MPRRRDERDRVLGPYWIEAKKQWKATLLIPTAVERRDRRTDRYFGDEKEARDWVASIRGKLVRLEGTTVGSAIKDYQTHLETKGTRSISYDETIRRLKLFFPKHDMQLAAVTEDHALEYYRAFTRRTYWVGPADDRREKRISVDYHRNALSEAKSFMSWAVGRKLITASPFDKVQGIGMRNKGKPQFTGDEARKFHEYAIKRALWGDLGALGVEMALLMGMRNSEIRLRHVRDLDLGGTVVRITRGKTKKAARGLAVPEILQEPLRAAAEGKLPMQYLFATKEGEPHTKSWLVSAMKRLCRGAGVPYVPPHGLRGTHSSLAIQIGLVSHAVADALGHEKVKTTFEHYAREEAVAGAQQGRALAVIQGGRR